VAVAEPPPEVAESAPAAPGATGNPGSAAEIQLPSAAPVPFVSEPEEERLVSNWSAIAIGIGIVALFSPWLFNDLRLTKWLAGGSLLVGAIASLGSFGFARKHDWTCNLVALIGGVLILSLAAANPGLLRPLWEIDLPVKARDLDTMVCVPAAQPRAPGKAMAADEVVDAIENVIRQEDVIVAVDSLSMPTLRPKGLATRPIPVVAVHVRLTNLGSETIPVSGFGEGATVPTLVDSAGNQFAFLEARRRVPDKQRAVFDAKAPLTAELGATMFGRSVGYLLLFERPPGANLDQAKLELPAAAWTRNGTCRFQFNGVFERTASGVTKQ